MRWLSGLPWAAVLLALTCGSQAADTSVYHDSETGFTFSQYNAEYQIGSSITIRIAVPSPVTTGSAYDAVIQMVAPKAVVGWTGLAWGGAMLNNPLTVFWENGNTPVISSRWATSRALPPTYSGATYEIFKTGTHVNSTHWQFTAKCTGCTSFSSSGKTTILSPTGQNSLAFAFSATKPSNPASSSSSFNVHDLYGYWTHDFSSAGNTAFASLVAKNMPEINNGTIMARTFKS